MASQRRALVVSTGRDRGALAAIRSLTDFGWTVGVGTPDGPGMVGSSRAAAVRYPVPRPRGDASAFVAGVRAAVTAGSYDVVFGSGDDWMAAVSAYRDQIPARVAHPPYEAVRLALDKVTLADNARHVGLVAPDTSPATDAALTAWQGPVVVKCRTHWTPGQVRPHRIEAKLFPDVGAATPQVERLWQAGAEPVLQTPVHGSLGALIGVFHDGRLRGRVQQVTSRLWPTPNGVSTRAQTVEVDEDLARRAEALLARIGW
ncbi:hypothetical protein PU560_02090, partial [Georgenia sp. 10Sc9-8]|nr:hypothetical protein [Georgenia halotolerans]